MDTKANLIQSHPLIVKTEVDVISLNLNELLPLPSTKDQREIELCLMIEYYCLNNREISKNHKNFKEYSLTKSMDYQKQRRYEVQQKAQHKKIEIKEQCLAIRAQFIDELSRKIVERDLDTSGRTPHQIIDLQERAKKESQEWFDVQVGKIEQRIEKEIKQYHSEIDGWRDLELKLCEEKIRSYQQEIADLRAGAEIKLPPSSSHVSHQPANHNTTVNTDHHNPTNGNGHNHDNEGNGKDSKQFIPYPPHNGSDNNHGSPDRSPEKRPSQWKSKRALGDNPDRKVG